MKTDVVIVGCGVAGLFCALQIPEDKKIVILTKAEAQECDSFLAQGGICVLKSAEDYDCYFEDTMRAGHYENRTESVDLMLRTSREVIEELIGFGVEFQRDEAGELMYTREGGHSTCRILFHEDETGKEITSRLLEQVKKRKNITLSEHTTMVDLLVKDQTCYGVVARKEDGRAEAYEGQVTLLATGGIGGIYEHSTNFPHLTGDSLALALKYGIALEHIDYVQIHPTTLYTGKPGRSFLISESVRGEGALLYNAKKERFIDELLPRDVVTAAIYRQMELEHTKHVWLDMSPLGEEQLRHHFPNIYKKCIEEGYDVRKDLIPVVPSQHYFMGGIHVDRDSKTSMNRLYAAGETSCNGVHGKNRLASNSLLESLVFAKRAALHMKELLERQAPICYEGEIDASRYEDMEQWNRQNREAVWKEIEREKREHESDHKRVEC